jgi:DNA-binding response OmpR family regulator
MRDIAPKRPLVMVVEDDQLIADTLEIALESRNYRVLGPVETEVAALKLLKTESPDVALIDFRLATTTTEILLERLNARHIAVCVLTGTDASELPPIYAGCTVLEKPFRLDILVRAIEHAQAA